MANARRQPGDAELDAILVELSLRLVYPPSPDLAARVRAQLPPEVKLPFADWVIDGEASLAETQRRVAEIWHALAGSPASGLPTL